MAADQAFTKSRNNSSSAVGCMFRVTGSLDFWSLTVLTHGLPPPPKHTHAHTIFSFYIRFTNMFRVIGVWSLLLYPTSPFTRVSNIFRWSFLRTGCFSTIRNGCLKSQTPIAYRRDVKQPAALADESLFAFFTASTAWHHPEIYQDALLLTRGDANLLRWI